MNKSFGMQSVYLSPWNVKYSCCIQATQDRDWLPQNSHHSTSGRFFYLLLATRLPGKVKILMSTSSTWNQASISAQLPEELPSGQHLNGASWLSSATTQRLKVLPHELTESPQRLRVWKHLIRVTHGLRKKKKKLRTWIRYLEKVTRWLGLHHVLCLLLIPTSFLFYCCEPTITKNVKAVTTRFRHISIHWQVHRATPEWNSCSSSQTRKPCFQECILF